MQVDLLMFYFELLSSWWIFVQLQLCFLLALFELLCIVSFILLVLLFIILSSNLEMLFDKDIPLLFDKGSLSFLPLSIFIIIDLSHDCGICSNNCCLNILQILFLLILPLYFYYFLGFLYLFNFLYGDFSVVIFLLIVFVFSKYICCSIKLVHEFLYADSILGAYNFW